MKHTMSNETPFPLCSSEHEHSCLTCADRAVPVIVIALRQEKEVALVRANEQADAHGSSTEEIDITLVGDVTVGDILLAHGGVALEVLSASLALTVEQTHE